MTPIVVLGEKNHGKSTLIGRLLYEAASIPKDRLKEIRNAIKKSGRRFEWAHLLDSFQYEREREMTLDTTRAVVKLGKKLFEFIDVPGHKELIKNMLVGASDAKYAILVIDASEGIKPQTLKHLKIAEFLGIKKFLAVVNKIDAINYSEAGFKKIKNKLSIPTLPLAAKTGVNLTKKSKKLKWFKGPTLQRAIEVNFKETSSKNCLIKSVKSAQNTMALCIFVKKPLKNLILESQRRSFQISKLSGFKKINSLHKISIKLKKRASVSDKFVIKTNGEIIGVCSAG